MKRVTGAYVESCTLGEVVKAFVPLPLPPQKPSLSLNDFYPLNHSAEMALARLSGVSGLVPLLSGCFTARFAEKLCTLLK